MFILCLWQKLCKVNLNRNYFKMEKKQAIVLSYYSMMMQTVLAAAAVLEEEKVPQRRARRCWAREHLLQRDRLGHGATLCKELLRDSETFYNFTRMSIQQFNELLSLVGSDLAKFSIRKPISERDRLMITLRFLATGSSYSSIGFSFRVAKCTVHNIIKETTQVIWNRLNETFIPKPNNSDLKQIAEDFYSCTGLPNCIGALDGKHCAIKAPANSGSLYFNYKKTFSIVLLAACDSNYNFTVVNVGAYGSESDGGILRRSEWGKMLLNNELSLPEPSALPNSGTMFPYFFVGDEAFPLKRHLLRPYGGRGLSADKRIFNTTLSKARRFIENTFGILTSKFRIFHTVICADPDLATSIVNSTVVLHNFIRKTKESSTSATHFQAENETDQGKWSDLQPQEQLRPTHEAQHLRDVMTNYLSIVN